MFNFWSSGHTSEHVVSHEIYRVIKFMQKLKSFKMFSYLGIVYRIKGTSHTRYYFVKIINGCHGNQGNIPKIMILNKIFTLDATAGKTDSVTHHFLCIFLNLMTLTENN